ncbi:MAG: beta-N-acetylglucosaminidase domain-containing protein [Caulobacteraceae bacterium]
MSATPELGTCEIYYGKPWSWADRRDQVSFLAPHGYRFFTYAPKMDTLLRKEWRTLYPDDEAQALRDFAAHCRAKGVRFGVGLSPYEIYRDFNTEVQSDLRRKLAQLDEIGVEDLCVMFDDMRGDLPELAATQARISHWIAERSAATRVIVCPTYYSDDPALDRFFGARPERYLEDFGAALDPAIGVWWTGEEVCSREYTAGHLQRVGEQLRRKPFLGDNYPVNDGAGMSPFLHLRGFTGRPASIGPHIQAHGVNPALQPVLTRIPALTLAESYARGEAYEYTHAFRRAARAVLGEDLGAMLERHARAFQDNGLNILGDAIPKLRARYAAVDHPGAREVVAYLDGYWRITQAEVEQA